MKKILTATLVTVMAVSICACGNPTKKHSSDAVGNADAVQTVATTRTTKITTVGTRETIAPVTEVYEGRDDISGLSGAFVESVDGVETNYIFINSLGNTMVEIGKMSPTAIGIETSEEGLMVYRGSKNPGDTYSDYSFDGDTLKFQAYGNDYVWTRIDMVPLDGSYNLVENGKKTDIWVFDDGKLIITNGPETSESTYTQTADQLIVENADGTKTEYTYIYDVFSIKLDDVSGNVLEFRAMI